MNKVNYLLFTLLLSSQAFASTPAPKKARTMPPPTSLEEDVKMTVAEQKEGEEIVLNVLTRDGKTIAITRTQKPYFGMFERLQLEEKATPLEPVTSDALNIFLDVIAMRKFKQGAGAGALFKVRSSPDDIYDYVRQADYLELRGFPLQVLLASVADYLRAGKVQLIDFPAVAYQDELARMYYLREGQDLDLQPLGYDKVPNFGFSIQELLDWNKAPAVSTLVISSFGRPTITYSLNLEHLRINDLNGLQNIPLITEVSRLDLDDNRLEELPPHAFASLPKLQNLVLSHNNLKRLQAGALAGLYDLRSLLLINNQLQEIEVGAFADLGELRGLYLRGNLLTQLTKDTFTGLQNLQTLGLRDNKLADVSSAVFEKLAELKELFMAGNNLSEDNKNTLQQALAARRILIISL